MKEAVTLEAEGAAAHSRSCLPVTVGACCIQSYRLIALQLKLGEARWAALAAVPLALLLAARTPRCPTQVLRELLRKQDQVNASPT